MKKVHPYLSRSVLIPALMMLVACTGTTIDEKSNGKAAERAADTPRTAASTPADPAVAPQDKTPQDPARERQVFFVANSLEEARRALELKLFGDAARLAAQVLEVESGNKEAREILATASELMGQSRTPTAGQRFEHEVTKRLVEQERDRFKAEQEMRVGDAHLEAGRYDDAIESYRRGALILRYSTSFTPGSTTEKLLEQKLADAIKAKTKADQDRETARRVASKKQLEDEEHKSRDRKSVV